MADALVIGTRGSELALFQAHWVAKRMRDAAPGMSIEIEIIETRGDQVRDVPLAQVGGKGIFTKELENALLDGRIDLAVHSLKDMPTVFPDGLMLGAIPWRANPFDALVCSIATSLADLPSGARVGTSSLRRGAQIRAYRPDLEILNLRGNVDTRVRRVREGALDAAILACAGLERLERHTDIAQVIPASIMIPAPGQGALAIELREDDGDTRTLVQRINDPRCAAEVTAERRCLALLEGGCQAPIGAHAVASGDRLTMEACVCSPDGQTCLRVRHEGDFSDPLALGDQVADSLFAQGAGAIIAAAR
ncbi:MAG: porphobilinogen deaminase [Candidatus Hydrogenedentota bacterium]